MDIVRVFHDVRAGDDACLVEQYDGTLAPIAKSAVRECTEFVIDTAVESGYIGDYPEHKGKCWAILSSNGMHLWGVSGSVGE